VRADNTGYDLAALFVGAEGTLGVVTSVDVRLYPIPAQRVTALCGFDDLAALMSTARVFRDVETIAALELIDGRAAALAAEHLGIAVSVRADWLLLVELAADDDQTARLATLLKDTGVSTEPAIGVDLAGQQRLWQVRESVAEVVTLFGPPLKFDVSLQLPVIPAFATASAALIARESPAAIPVLFGHVGEGNLHLNVLGCDAGLETRIYAPMMELIAAHGGNVSSEHGVGSLKRAYLPMSREPADITAMRAIKNALDPTGYLNPAVLFD
jgi:FAD/FMN-containing dehydrogenase